MADYDWFDYHNTPVEPSSEELRVKELRSQGFHPGWFEHFIGSRTTPDYWNCRRGCGCLVWDPETHMKNVCTTFEPVVGS